jgi:vancomycin resistance protein VanJ
VQTLLRTARQLLIATMLLYSIALVALTVVWTLNLYQRWWLTLASMFAILLFLPLLLLIPAALLIRSWGLRAAAAITLAAFLALFGSRLLPPATPASGGAALRVMTFNHLFRNQRVDAIITAIRSQNADVVALQELSQPVASAIMHELRGTYAYQYLRPSDTQQGLGIISRYPFQSATELQDDFLGLQVTMQIEHQTVTLIGLHLGSPVYKTRWIHGLPIITGYDASLTTRQVGRVAQFIDHVQGPLIVAGDFNTSDREPRYQQLATRMHDAFGETGWGFGYSFPDHKRFGPVMVPFPLLRIDYIWSKGGALPTASHVECNNTGADHCFLVADLRLGAAQ